MTTYTEASKQIRKALNSNNPKREYTGLVASGMDLSELTNSEILMLNSQFAGNQCILFRSMTAEQRECVAQAMNNNHLILWD